MNIKQDYAVSGQGNSLSQLPKSLARARIRPWPRFSVKYSRLAWLYITTLIFSLLFQIPGWPEIFEKINFYPMIDRTVYKIKIITYNLSTDYIFDFDLLSYFTREWLWNSSIAYLNRQVGLNPDQIFFIVTTIVIWRFAFEIASRANWLCILFLINPLVIDFAFSQLRLAFAMAILSFFWSGQRGRFITIVAYMVCTSIHTATILFAIMHFSANRFSAPTRKNLTILCLTGTVIALAIGPFREIVLSGLEDRRATYSDMSSSTTYLLFWVLMWMLLLSRWKYSVVNFDGRYSIIVLSIVAVNIVTGGYSTRFIAAAFPSLIITMVKWPSKPVSLVLMIFMPYSILQWFYWLRLV